VLLAACTLAGSRLAGAEAVESEPVRCWWRTSTSAVRVGEVFTVVLTCAATETRTVTAVIDRSRLDPEVAQWPPFEIVGGKGAPDLVTADTRFFQYEYHLRLISDGYFNRDIALPDLPVQYRIRRSTGDEANEGAPHTYALPSASIRILSLVPPDTRDIRDMTAATFSSMDDAKLRADLLVRSGATLSVLALGVALIGLVHVVRTPGGAGARARLVSERAVLRGVARELGAVERQRHRSGWTPALKGRALAALRVLGAYAINRPVQQSARSLAGHLDGSVPVRRVLVSSAVTEMALIDASAARPDDPNAAVVRDLAQTLAAFSRSQYSRGDDVADEQLDRGLAAAQALARRSRFARTPAGRLARALAAGARRRPRRMDSA
jgi:hypothetical protein